MADEQSIIKAYGLGSGGVNVVKSPIHLDDNELTKAQNAVPDNTSGLGSIRKRDGLVGLNGTPMAGAVYGTIGLPLPDFGSVTRTLYAAMGNASASNKWKTSTDGTTWANASSPALSQRRSKLTDALTFFYFNNRIVGFNRRLYFPKDDYVQYPTANSDAPPLNSWDGTTDTTIAQVPFNPGSGAAPGDTDSYCILDMVIHKGDLYISVFDPSGGSPDRNGRVFRVNTVTGSLTQIGNRFGDGTGEVVGGMPWALCSYQGLLYVGVYGATGAGVGRVYRINTAVPTATWDEDNPTGSPLNGYITSMVQYKGNLYLGLMEDDGVTVSQVAQRTSAGAYSNVKAGAALSIDGGNHWILLGVFNGLLFAANINVAGTPDVSVIWSFDGTTWVSEHDVWATYAININAGQAVEFGGAFYVVFHPTSDNGTDGFILKRTTGGTWSRVLNGANLRGPIGILEVET